jgi:predicted Rossmann-fold nucleotide-binding protein
MSTVIVCGGREFRDRESLNKVLDAFHRVDPITALVSGGAPGADALAEDWAVRNKVTLFIERARWGEEGRAAGPIRNARMLRLHRPTHVIAFPGGSGTADMVKRARAADVPVITVTVASTPHQEKP